MWRVRGRRGGCREPGTTLSRGCILNEVGGQRLGSRLGWVGEWYSREVDWLKQTKVQNHEILGCVSEPQQVACG